MLDLGGAPGRCPASPSIWKGQFSLRDQIERAALSVSNNIAEGFERGTTNELLAFLYIARGSAGEVRSMLNFIERRPAFANFKSQISNLKSESGAAAATQREHNGLTSCSLQGSADSSDTPQR